MDDLRLVIFDMDGLLFDTERISYIAMKKMIENHGFRFSLDNYRSIIGLGSERECEEIFQRMYGSDVPFNHIFQDYDSLLKSLVREEADIVKKGAKSLLNALDQRGIKKCIASSSSRSTIQYYLEISGLYDRFDFFVGGEEVEYGKPHPDIFLEACYRANETPESVIVLEDSLNGLRAANRAGIRCIVVPDLIEPNEEMNKLAHQIVSDLGKVMEILPS